MKFNGLYAVCAVAVLATSTVYANADSNTLQYYCHDKGNELQRSVTVGKGTRIQINNSTYSYQADPMPIQPSFQFIEDHLINVGGVSSECAEFLMTKGDKAFSKDGVLARVHFAFDSSELTDQSRYILDTLLARLKYSNKIVLEGHTDNIGDKQYNFTLGANRAIAVSNFMEKHVNTPYNIVKISKGETEPLADNSTSEGRYLNRRVDIK